MRALRTIRLLKNPFLKNAIINYYKKIYGINIGDFKKLPEDLKRRIITNTIERPSRDFLLFIKYCNKLELLRADGRKLINTFKMYINNTLLFQNPAYRLAICNKVANMHNRDTAMHIWKFWEAMYHFQFNEMRNLLKLASTVDKYPAGRDLTQWEELDRTISIVELAERMEDPYYLQDPAGHNVTQRKRSVKTIIKYNKTPTFGLNGQLATRSLQNETQMSTEVILSELRACNLFLSKAEETFSPQNATLPFFDTWTNKFTKNQRNLFVRMRKQILEKALHNNSRSFTQPVTPISSPLWPYYLWRVDALLDKKRTKK